MRYANDAYYDLWMDGVYIKRIYGWTANQRYSNPASLGGLVLVPVNDPASGPVAPPAPPKPSGQRYRTLRREHPLHPFGSGYEVWVVSHEFWLAHRSFLELFGVSKVENAREVYDFPQHELPARCRRGEKHLKAIIERAKVATRAELEKQRGVKTAGETLQRAEARASMTEATRRHFEEKRAEYKDLVRKYVAVEHSPSDMPPAFMPNAGDRVAVQTSYGWVDEVVTGGPRLIAGVWVSYAGSGPLKSSTRDVTWRIVHRRPE